MQKTPAISNHCVGLCDMKILSNLFVNHIYENIESICNFEAEL